MIRHQKALSPRLGKPSYHAFPEFRQYPATIRAVTPEEKVAIRAKGQGTIHCVHPLAGFPLYDGLTPGDPG
jgi:hypothetical protein